MSFNILKKMTSQKDGGVLANTDRADEGGRGVGEMLTMADIGGTGVGEMLTMSDKGGRGELDPPIFG